MKFALGLLMVAVSARAAAEQTNPPAQPAPILQELRLSGATVFDRDDVLWLLRLREGAPLPQTTDEIAKALQERYERDGYTEARVTGSFEAGRLTLTVDEGRIDDVEVTGSFPHDAIARFAARLAIKPGDIYNKRSIGQATARLERESQGALSVGEVKLTRRGGRNVLVVPVEKNSTHNTTSFGNGREDLFSPVDGFSPSLAFSTTIFDSSHFNHTFVSVYGSYKFGSDSGGFSVGGERPLFRGPRLFLGGEIHDLTASDDRWRLGSLEQTLVAVGFKNSFRDYYRRRGAQVFAVFRAGSNNELSAMARWDRHEPLDNATSYSFFRDDAVFRRNPLIQDEHVNALVFGYTFDTRPLTGAGRETTYMRHLKDDLFGYALRQRPGLRLEWTSEVAGHGMNGDAEFDRHILDARGYVATSPRTLLALRGLFGFSNGTLPLERQFALGGIGSVHGYRFKEEAGGTSLVLLNAEYRFDLLPRHEDATSPLGLFVFYDTGRTNDAAWLRGTGFGFSQGSLRIEFGFRANAIPRSRQVLVRFTPNF